MFIFVIATAKHMKGEQQEIPMEEEVQEAHYQLHLHVCPKNL